MKKHEKDKIQRREDDEGGSGGKSGEVVFRFKDAMSIDPRDDALSPEETRRLLAVHVDIHKERVDKQKNLRKERKNAKEGPAQLVLRQAYRGGMGSAGGSYSKYKTHPIAIKFSGIRDQQISLIPSENVSETNKEQREELQNRLDNRLENRPQMRPGLSNLPKPRPM